MSDARDANTAILAALGVDFNYQYPENLTALFTASCSNSMNSWLESVESACALDQINQGGSLVQAKMMPLLYTYQYSLVCLEDSSGNMCLLESQTWTGSDFERYSEDLCWQDDPPAICNDTDFSIAQIDPSMMAVPNLYDTELYCSECFLKLWRQRLLPPFLATTNFTDYLIK